MTSVPTALFAPTTHASFFRVVGAWRYLTTGAHPCGVAWADGGAVARRAATTPAVAAATTPPAHCRHYHHCRWSGAVGSALGGAARLQRARVSRVAGACAGGVRCLLCPGSGQRAPRPRQPRSRPHAEVPACKLLPVFSLCSCMCGCGGWVGGRVCGAGCAGRAQSQTALPSTRHSLPLCPLGNVDGFFSGAKLEPIPHLPPFIGAAMLAPHQRLVGVPGLHCMRHAPQLGYHSHRQKTVAHTPIRHRPPTCGQRWEGGVAAAG